MVLTEVQAVLSKIEQQLAGVGALDPVVEQSVRELLNLVEQLVSGQQALVQEVERLKQQLEQKKRGKTTDKNNDSAQNRDHSSENHRRKRQKPKRSSASDRRTFKDLPIYETIECPVDPEQLPPDAKRCFSTTRLLSNPDSSGFQIPPAVGFVLMLWRCERALWKCGIRNPCSRALRLEAPWFAVGLCPVN